MCWIDREQNEGEKKESTHNENGPECVTDLCVTDNEECKFRVGLDGNHYDT